MPGDASGWAVAPVARGSVALFLALYLLLLAFFIMLTALSSLETQRAGAVMDSLGETFRQAPAAGTPPEAPMPLDVLDAERRAAEAFLSVVRDLFEGTVPAARVETISAGRALEVLVPAQSLFETDAAAIRDARVPLFDGLVAALTAVPSGMRFELAALLQTGGEAAFPPPPDALAPRRATALARLMAQRGAVPGSVVTGLAQGPEDRVRLVFRVVDPRLARLDPASEGRP